MHYSIRTKKCKGVNYLNSGAHVIKFDWNVMPKKPEISEEEYEPLDPPVVTYTLLALIWLIFIAMSVASKGQFMAFSSSVCDLFGDKINSRLVLEGHAYQWWRLLTPIFLHGGITHIAVNSYSLYVMGRQLEPFYGSRRFLLVFITAGVAGVLGSFWFSQSASLGASGAIFGLIGAGIVFPIRFKSLVAPEQGKQIVKQLVMVALLNLGLGFGLRGYVDNAAHVGGLIGGGIAALFLLPDALNEMPYRKFQERSVTLFTGLYVASVLLAAILQARWAMGPWWRLVPPAGFIQIGNLSRFEGSWKSKDGSEIDITDTVHNLNIANNSAILLQQRGGPNSTRMMDGHYTRVLTLNSQTETIKLVLIVLQQRIVLISMRTKTSNYPLHQAEFEKVISDFKVFHMAPPDLKPIAIITPKRSETPKPANP